MKIILFTGVILLLSIQKIELPLAVENANCIDSMCKAENGTLIAACEALKCSTCVASNEEECNKQGSQTCPPYADGCYTIIGPNSMIKSCSYKTFYDQSQLASGGVNMDYCFTDDCNGPAKGRSASTGNDNSATSIFYNPTLIRGAFLVRWLFCRL